MANVVQISPPHTYLRSVNTPDYPEDDWLINPDLSAVEGLAECFWCIENNQVVPMSEVNQQLVRDKQQEGTYYTTIAGMKDGSPAFFYAPISKAISIAKSEYVFASNTKIGAKSFNLASQESPDGTIFVPSNFVLTSASATLLEEARADVTLTLYSNGLPVHQSLIAEGKKNCNYNELAVLVDENSYLTCSVVSGKDVVAPTITYVMHWR